MGWSRRDHHIRWRGRVSRWVAGTSQNEDGGPLSLKTSFAENLGGGSTTLRKAPFLVSLYVQPGDSASRSPKSWGGKKQGKITCPRFSGRRPPVLTKRPSAP